MRKIRNFLCFFICSFHLNCPTTEEQMLYFTIFCLFRHSFIKKIEEKSNGLDFFDYICIVKLSEY